VDTSNSLNDDSYCFACGTRNPIGLGMRVEYAPDRAFCRIVLSKHFQGWSEIAHGGIVSTLLDEIMAHAVFHHAGKALTARLNIRFRSMAPIGKPLDVSGWIDQRKKRVIEAKGEIRLSEDKSLVAQGESRFLLTGDLHAAAR